MNSDRSEDRKAWIAQLRRDYAAGNLDLGVDPVRDLEGFERLMEAIFDLDGSQPPPAKRSPDDR